MARNYFITGGAGFIGSNYVHRLVSRGENVTVYDNLSRAGAPKNITWLEETFGKEAFKLIVGDLRDDRLLTESAREADVIVHLGGQVAVTTSVINPREDFEINALGTFNALEAARLSGRKPIFLYSSTNKVYGGMEDVEITEEATRWLYKDLVGGASEKQPLDLHSPYGVSKGSGDQYTRDYSRIYGLRSVVFRQSCVAGPRQFGVEDQGWLAWMMIAAVTGKQITIYGDGKQVRDVLFVDDRRTAQRARRLGRVWSDPGTITGQENRGRARGLASWRPACFLCGLQQGKTRAGLGAEDRPGRGHRNAVRLGEGE
jgi:CDP-paratose 2-epimerase